MDMSPKYLSYDEYTNVGGTLSETEFNYYGYEAESYIDWYTFNRLHGNETIPDEVKRCEFYLIRLIHERCKAMGVDYVGTSQTADDRLKSILSMSNDGVSTSFNSLGAKDALAGISSEIGQVVNRFLQGVSNELGRKLLYRGLYEGE